MDINDLAEYVSKKTLYSFVCMKNPQNLNQWFLTAVSKEGKVSLLVDDADQVITYDLADDVIALAKHLGIGRLEFHL